jgi:hypothetical protein
MMCLACEQDAIWFAYLESRGLLKQDDPAAIEALFGSFPVQPLPMRQKPDEEATNESAQGAQGDRFSCDDPTADAADLKAPQPGRKQQ